MIYHALVHVIRLIKLKGDTLMEKIPQTARRDMLDDCAPMLYLYEKLGFKIDTVIETPKKKYIHAYPDTRML